MQIISRNIRRLNGRMKQRILRNIIMTENPDILPLQETKCAGTVVENLFSKSWKKSNFMFNDSRGVARGLAILWNKQSPFWRTFTLLNGRSQLHTYS